MSQILFDKFDKDGSGSIDVTEFGALCYDRGYFLSDSELQLAVKIVDKDGSGEIQFAEFEKWWKSNDRFGTLQMDEKQQEKLQQCIAFFQYYDADKSGNLDKKEFEALHKQLMDSGYQLKDCASAISEIDKSGDGEVNFNEFLAWMISMGCFNS